MEDRAIIEAIRRAAAAAGVPFNILLAQARVESGLNPRAVGDGGASIGLFQIQPRWWAAWAKKRGWDLHTPEGNAMAAAHILKGHHRLEGDWTAALRRYNGGPRWANIAQTATYASKVLKQAQAERAFVAPVAGKYGISAKFGQKGPRWKKEHDGLDIDTEEGRPVLSFAGGKVVATGYHDSYGNFVTYVDDMGHEHMYAHLSKINVTKGERLEPGEMVGRVGSTGNSTGAHLHWRVRKDGKLIDPSSLLKRVGQAYEADAFPDPLGDEDVDPEAAADSFAAAIKKYLGLAGQDVDQESIKQGLLGLIPAPQGPDMEAGEDETAPLIAAADPTWGAIAGPLSAIRRMVGEEDGFGE